MSKDSKGFKEPRSSTTGRFVTEPYAKAHPNTTQVEIVPKKGHGDSGRYDGKK